MPTEVYKSHIIELGPELPNEVLEVARQQGEDPDQKLALIQEFRDLIYARGECEPHRMDDDFLIKFLRSRYWKLEHSYRLLLRYHEFRAANKKFYEGVHPILLRSLGDDEIVSVPPYRDQHGRRLIIYKIANWRPSKVPIEDLFKATLLIMEIGSLEPQSQILGAVGIFDLEGLSMNQAWQVSPSLAQKVIQLLVTHMPVRVAALHIVNQGWLFDTAFQLFKPFLNEKMREKIFIHGNDLAALHSHIVPERLPVRYGGTQPESPYIRWLEKLKYNEKVIKQIQQLGYVIDQDEMNQIPDSEE